MRLLARHFRGARAPALAAVLIKGLAAASALLLQWLVARIFGAEGSGDFALMSTTVLLVSMVALWGQDILAMRNIAGSLAAGSPDAAQGSANAGVRMAIIGSAVATVTLLAIGWFYGVRFGAVAQTVLLCAIPASAALILGKTYSAIARADGKVLRSQLQDGPITSSVALVVVVAIALTMADPPFYSFAIAFTLAHCLGAIFAAHLGNSSRRGWPAASARPSLAPLFVAGVPIVVASSTSLVSDWSVIFATTASFGSDAAGKVRIVTLFLSVTYLVAIAVDGILLPKFAAAMQVGDQDGVTATYRAHILLSSTLALPVTLFGFLFAPQFLALFGPEFVDAAVALRVGAILQFATILLGPAGGMLVMGHHERKTLIASAVGLLVLVLGCFVLIPRMGVNGAIVTSSLVHLSRRITEVALVRFSKDIPSIDFLAIWWPGLRRRAA